MDETERAREAGAARAALVVAGLLWLAAAPPWQARGPDPGPLCRVPREAQAVDAATRQVRCAEEGEVALRGPARLLFGQPLDLNRESAATLEVLPGIGPARARAIVAERERAPFRSVDEVQRVRGIGPRTVERLRGLVVVADPPRRDAPPDAG